MDSDTSVAVMESLKLINSSLQKLFDRIEVLERDFKDREAKRRFFKWLIAFYPLIIGFMLLIVDADHRKMVEVASDISDLVNDSKSLIMYAGSYDN